MSSYHGKVLLTWICFTKTDLAILTFQDEAGLIRTSYYLFCTKSCKLIYAMAICTTWSKDETINAFDKFHTLSLLVILTRMMYELIIDCINLCSWYFKLTVEGLIFSF